jgi:3-oxoacyl-[acyl-carrier protein] reductase
MLQSAHVTPRKVDSVVKSLAAKGVVEWGEAVNAADPVALQRWVESAAVELAGIDILVCNVSALAVGNTPETCRKRGRIRFASI